MKVALLANANSIYTVDLVKYVHQDDNVLLISNEQISDFFKDKYKRDRVSIYELSKGSGFAGILIKCFRMVKAFSLIKRNSCEVLVFHAPPYTKQARILSILAKGIKAKKCSVFWGPDINTCPRNKAKNLHSIISQCEKINLSTVQMRKTFRELFGNVFDDRICDAQFGSPALEAIRQYVETFGSVDNARKKAKNAIGVEEERISVAIGFGGRREHNHILVIEELSKLSEKIKSRLYIIVHLGYGGDEDYFQEIRYMLKGCGMEYIIIENQLELEKVAELRLATDILIHAQYKDALSSSIRECLYAESRIINPSWIHYDELNELGIEFAQYDDFSGLNNCLESVIEDRVKIDTNGNSEKIYRNFSWKNNIPKWRELMLGNSVERKENDS